MGGKNKQRTKGNLRPSNSGRAAELLAKEQGTVPGFIGFGTSHSDLGYVPAVQGAEDIDSLVDSDFRMVLRKLSKKDVTTKLKAMQEFGIMCTERDTEAVKGVLPYWPRIFCKISLDHDRRVREATQQAFEKLILKVKKHLAPYLKSVMGYWLMAQCDTYPPAALAAKDAFEAAFPPSKQPEAIAFCKEEITTVRSAYFELVSALCQHVPQVMKEEAAKVSPSVLLSIDDSDPVVCPALWEAVLYTLTTIEDCWFHVNAKKSVFPKLMAMIREGGRGLAAVMYPYLLPFISKLPQSITEPKLDFFKNFLTSLVTGLSTERTKSSSSECSAVISAFFECLRFIMQQNLGEEEMVQMLINEQVKARATTREVMATYTIEDIVIELIIQLPSNYPLGSITVESGKRIGVAVQQWRNWMLQLSTYLTHQNGSIMEGLALWKNNVDKRFEGVEDCMICFSVIHGFNYSLPKKACRTCKKKFHSACLYKWFTSSNKSTCPLCRETFF